MKNTKLNNIVFYDRFDTKHDRIFRNINLIARTFKYKIIHKKFLNIFTFRKTVNNIYFTDHINLLNLVAISILVFIGKVKKITIHSFEMYFIDYKALIESFLIKENFKIFQFLKSLCKLFLLNFLIKIFDCKIIFANRLRKIFWQKKNPKSSAVTFVIRNKIISNNFKFTSTNHKIRLKKYFFIPGNINNKKDLLKLVLFCKVRKIKIITTHLSSKSNLFNKNKDVFILKGYLNTKDIFNYTKFSLANVCLYDNSKINQKLAASMKLYESMTMSKNLIISNNPGLIDTLKEEKYKKFIFVDKLSTKHNFVQNKTKIIKNLFFEREIFLFFKKNYKKFI